MSQEHPVVCAYFSTLLISTDVNVDLFIVALNSLERK